MQLFKLQQFVFVLLVLNFILFFTLNLHAQTNVTNVSSNKNNLTNNSTLNVNQKNNTNNNTYERDAPIQVPRINLGISPSNSPEDVSVALQIIILLTVLSLAPSILMMVTSFTRIVIVLSFVRRALATQQLPSNQILIGLSLILTFFVMSPTLNELNDKCLKPYFAREITQLQALDKASEIFKQFMLKQTREHDLALFIKIANLKKLEKKSDVPMYVLIPAYIISELKIAFEMGLIIFLPFLVIDMVVASILMSMGMMMLPPAMISLPFKILIFVLADGWHLIIKSLVSSFQS